MREAQLRADLEALAQRAAGQARELRRAVEKARKWDEHKGVVRTYRAWAEEQRQKHGQHQQGRHGAAHQHGQRQHSQHKDREGGEHAKRPSRPKHARTDGGTPHAKAGSRGAHASRGGQQPKARHRPGAKHGHGVKHRHKGCPWSSFWDDWFAY